MAQLSSAWLVGQDHASCDRGQKKIESTSKFKVHEVIYDKGGFAVATGYWDSGSNLRLACRWHNPQDPNALGYPQTFGKPQWMMLPEKDIGVTCENLLQPADKKTLIITLKG